MDIETIFALFAVFELAQVFIGLISLRKIGVSVDMVVKALFNKDGKLDSGKMLSDAFFSILDKIDPRCKAYEPARADQVREFLLAISALMASQIKESLIPGQVDVEKANKFYDKAMSQLAKSNPMAAVLMQGAQMAAPLIQGAIHERQKVEKKEGGSSKRQSPKKIDMSQY